MGLARVFDRRLEFALKDAKEILLVVRGENKVKGYQDKPQSHKKRSKPKKSIEEIVTHIDLLDNIVEEGQELITLRALGNTGISYLRL